MKRSLNCVLMLSSKTQQDRVVENTVDKGVATGDAAQTTLARAGQFVGISQGIDALHNGALAIQIDRLDEELMLPSTAGATKALADLTRLVPALKGSHGARVLWAQHGSLAIEQKA
jgi:hypothetical protein